MLEVINEPMQSWLYLHQARHMLKHFYPQALARLRVTEQRLGVVPWRQLQVQGEVVIALRT